METERSAIFTDNNIRNSGELSNDGIPRHDQILSMRENILASQGGRKRKFYMWVAVGTCIISYGTFVTIVNLM